VADAFEEFGDRHSKAIGELDNDADPRVSTGSFDSANVGQVEPGALCELLLRQPQLQAQPTYVAAEGFEYVPHPRNPTVRIGDGLGPISLTSGSLGPGPLVRRARHIRGPSGLGRRSVLTRQWRSAAQSYDAAGALRRSILPTLGLVLVLAGCGGSSNSNTGTTSRPRAASTPVAKTNAAASSAVAKAQAEAAQLAQCYTIAGDEATVGKDSGKLVKSASNTAFLNQAVADFDSLKTAVEQIEPRATATELPILQQYTHVLDRLVQAIQAQASGNPAAAAGDLTGVSLEFQQLNPQIVPICTSDARRSTTATTPAMPASQTAPPAASVQQAVVSILNTCMSHGFNASVDLAPVKTATGELIGLSQVYSMDARMGPSSLKAHTLRQALTNIRGALRTCSPDDAARLDAVLGS